MIDVWDNASDELLWRGVIEHSVSSNPDKNTELQGLYRSKGIYCTQCEAEGFRRITYFLDRPDVLATYRVRVEADPEAMAFEIDRLGAVSTAGGPIGNHGNARVTHVHLPRQGGVDVYTATSVEILNNLHDMLGPAARDLLAEMVDRFGDDDRSRFEQSIDALGAVGVTKGCNPPENTSFCPDRPVTREQMASFFARALGLGG